ncbi:hypothetical protein C8239_08685 [Paracidovorax avenae]|uniref:hypothetical protein n=1 Tax=Paracidovorax avenae TaxID=80867 RepID=UPI0006B36965|nr:MULTISPECIES: hypothetical protein [Comamonadaceae]AVS84818.1 hypothetical protein C8239_08685 [Paracidovorax avenae]AVS88201.1 hypothetical protein C8238_08115 [Paracidovorax avenae]AVS95718.1 hypothetical protein C8232_05145 [Paracidovorax avenae]AVT02401.1 hypothetical protein C8243_07760 [Paracidovorax avenae]MDA8451103.1 hypothetical protein [Acidovorax sp. GBBC 3297]
MPACRSALFAAAALSAGLWSASASAACYVVYSSSQQVIYRSQTPPVDLAQQIHQTLPRVAPGSTLVFSLDSGDCQIEFNRLPAGASVPGSRVGLPPSDPVPRLVRPARS